MTQRRNERRPITGASCGYQISADGTPRKWNRRLPITKDLGGLPTVTIDGVDRLLDEIVCLAFHGHPPFNIRGMTVDHFDGNMWNCAADNVAWRVDPEWLIKHEIHKIVALLRPSHLRTRVRLPPAAKPTHPSRRIYYFGG
jgi:hypothetical protein